MPQERELARCLKNFRDDMALLKDFVREDLVEGIDYGLIKGTDKKDLLKPGAEKLCALFGIMVEDPEILASVEDWTGETHGGEPMFAYLVRQPLRWGGTVLASQCGSCNSRETKYRYRQADRHCPKCGAATIRRSKNPPPQDGWYCFGKIGGCGANFPANAKEIVDQAAGKTANPDLADLANTILKMAQKRALIAAVKIATCTSGLFAGGPAPAPAPTQKTATRSNGDKKPATPMVVTDVPAEIRKLLVSLKRTEEAAVAYAYPGKKKIGDLTPAETGRLYDKLLEISKPVKA